MIKCKNCEKELNIEDKFCRSCGTEALPEDVIEVNEQTISEENEEAFDECVSSKINKRKNEFIVIMLLTITLTALGFGFYVKNRMVLRQVLSVAAYNQNIVASDDKYIYYLKSRVTTQDNKVTQSKFDILKTSFTGSDTSSLSKELGYNIKNDNKNIYYVTDSRKLIRTKMDGSDSKTILEENSFILDYAIYGKYIYYLLDGTSRQLFRIKLDGNDKIEIGKDVLYFTIYQDKIYYTSPDDNYYGCRLNSIDLQDNKTSFIIYIDGVQFCIKDENIYFKEIDRQESYIYFKEIDGEFSNRNHQNRYRYSNAEYSQNNIYKMPLKGGNKVKLTDAVVTSFFITDNYLFYSKLNDGGAIYKCNLNGNNETKIYDKRAVMMTLKDGYIYTLNYNQENLNSSRETIITRISLDGKEVQTLN